MQTQHEEIKCSHEHIHHHGKRRKRCADCGKTWTRWKRKRGRKRRPRRTKRLAKTFTDKLTLVQQARRSKVRPSTFVSRHRQLLAVACKQQWGLTLPERGNLVLIADGKWYAFQKEKWTLYLIALRPVTTSRAIFLPPLLLPGRESLTGWQYALSTIPEDLGTRIIALVSDGFRGVETIVREQGWVHQRCHFHLLASFQCMLGRNKNVSFRKGRQQIYRSVCAFLTTTDARTLYRERNAIARCGVNRLCPARLRRKLRELLRREDEFRAYLFHPNLHLPATTNVMESMNAQLNAVESRSHGFRTPASVERWAAAHIRHNPTMTCNGQNLQN